MPTDDGVAVGVATTLAGHCRPAAEIVPCEGGLDDRHVGRMLEDRVVDGDALDGGKLGGEHGIP